MEHPPPRTGDPHRAPNSPTSVVAPRINVEWVPINRLFCNPANPRLNDAAVPHVAASIKRFGWQQPVVAKPSGEVIAGNTRLKAAMSLKMSDVPVVWFTGPDIEATAYSIADNKLHEMSSWDEPALARILEQLKIEDALDGIGYNSEDIDKLLDELKAAVPPGAVDDPGPGKPPETPVSRVGDLWVMGSHRILCGDSTKTEDIARLMAGEKAALLSTDPPYCVDYTGDNRPIHEGKRSGKDWSHVYREVDIGDFESFISSVFQAVLPQAIPSAPIYIWHAHVQQHVLAKVFERFDILFHQVIVWVKPTGVFGHSYYQWRHEPCAFGWLRGHKPTHGHAQLNTVWEVDWEGKSRITGDHPTIKPLRLFEIPMEQHTKPGAIVLEPFSGSGSQIIAAEKLGRRCRAMEIQPAFVDVAIRRWEGATGKQANLEATGQTFTAVTKDRRGSATADSPSGTLRSPDEIAIAQPQEISLEE